MPNQTKPIATTVPAAKPPSKSAQVIKLLGRTKGATIAELEEPTGWQPHSTRAFLSGLRKKAMTIAREPRKTGETAYRLVTAAGSAPHARTPSVADHEPPETAPAVEIIAESGTDATTNAAVASEATA